MTSLNTLKYRLTGLKKNKNKNFGRVKENGKIRKASPF